MFTWRGQLEVMEDLSEYFDCLIVPNILTPLTEFNVIHYIILMSKIFAQELVLQKNKSQVTRGLGEPRTQRHRQHQTEIYPPFLNIPDIERSPPTFLSFLMLKFVIGMKYNTIFHLMLILQNRLGIQPLTEYLKM